MATTANIQVLLKYYVSRLGNPQVIVADFCDYVKRYAQHHLEEQKELLPYVTDTVELVKKELDRLADEKQIVYVSLDPEKQEIVYIGYFIEKCSEIYQKLKINPTVPYPSDMNLQKNIPSGIVQKLQADVYFSEHLENTELDSKTLYCLQLPRDLPPILYPSNMPASDLMEIALSKFQLKLQKDEFYEYFLKKLKIANPGKDISVKNFFKAITQKTDTAITSIKNAADTFYQWNQLCFFVRQDYDKVKDFTAEDISLLQSVYILEFCISFYRNKAQQALQKETALKNLELNLNKPPYYFTRDAIESFSDSRGVPLLGQYSEKDLQEYLLKATTESLDDKLPPLLTFRGVNGTYCYVQKSKVIPLIIRLCTDARETVRDLITNECHAKLKKFQPIPEFKNQDLFEKKLEASVIQTSPVLYAILQAGFLRSLYQEMRGMSELVTGHIHLFTDGQLSPYSELLLISKEEIVTDAKIMLPVWYTIPGISWFMSLFMAPPKQKQKKKTAQSTQKKIFAENEVPQFSSIDYSRDAQVSRKEELKKAAEDAEKKYVPEGSTLERELHSYEQTWNKMLSPQARENLTEDVNSLIRDYMRKILKTLRANNFTPERIRNLADTLVKTPNMQKIKDHAELHMYIQLYMIKLIKGL